MGVRRGGGGGWKFLVTEFFCAKTSSWGLKTQTKKTKNYKLFFPTKFGGGGGWDFGGVWGARRPHPGVARGRLGSQKLSSGNLGGGRIKKK